MTPPEYVIQQGNIAYPDVIDALSRGLITHEMAAAVVRMIFRLEPSRAATERDD